VTLIDAFRIKELNLLIFSYLFRQAHNSFILHVENFIGGAVIEHKYYLWGSFIGVILTGIFLDLVMQNRRFLTVFLLNIVMFVWDIYLFVIARQSNEKFTPNAFVTGLLGAVLSSNDLIYLVMIPMYMAKNHSERIANE
jgi:sugar phosphate permease